MENKLTLEELKKKLEEDFLGKIPLYHSQLSPKKISDVEGKTDIKNYLILKKIKVDKYQTPIYRVLKPYKKAISKIINHYEH